MSGHCGNKPSTISQYLVDSTTIIIKNYVYTPILTTINIDDATTIEFNVKDWGVGFYDMAGSLDPNLYLESIKWYYDEKIIKTTRFEYQRKYRNFFLLTILNNGQMHNFEYNLGNYTLLATMEVDHWGFWNGSINKLSFTNIQEDRRTNTDLSTVGLLNKIIYPTGGRTEIEYEYNRYNYYIESGSADSILSKKSVVTPCGGARVKSIKDYDPVSAKYYNKKTYQYKNALNGEETGIIKLDPDTKYKIDAYPKIGKATTPTCNYAISIFAQTVSYSNIGFQDMWEYHVSYPSIFEIYEDNSYTHYYYTSYLDIPDRSDTYFKLNNTEQNSKISSWLPCTGFWALNDLSRFRGKLKSKTIYDSDGAIKQQQLNTYNHKTGDKITDYTVAVKSGPQGPAAYYIYHKPCLLTEQINIDENRFYTKVRYEYNKYNLISQTETYNSNNDTFISKYKYLNDYTQNINTIVNTTGIGSLHYKNINGLIEKTDFARINGRDYLTGSQLFRFTLKNNVAVPITESFIQTNELISDFRESYIQEGGHIIMDDRYGWVDNEYIGSEVYYSEHDEKGNIIEMIKGGTSTTCLWAYKGQYPIAVIENATYSEVLNSMGSAMATQYNNIKNSLTPADETIRNIVNAVRKNLPQAQVTTYTYLPLIGISSQTDPRGVTTYYNYDTSNRIKEIYIIEDGTKKVLEAYKHFFQNEY